VYVARRVTAPALPGRSSMGAVVVGCRSLRRMRLSRVSRFSTVYGWRLLRVTGSDRLRSWPGGVSSPTWRLLFEGYR
jgi:hypothetical protein